MKRLILILCFLAPLLYSCSSDVNIPDPPTPSTSKKVKIEINNELQVMDGFGASDAWRCQMVGENWPIAKREAIADLLFSKDFDSDGNPKGIGLSIWRFYLGAGSKEQGGESMISDEWRRGECFQNSNGTYNWEKQKGQRWFLQAAKKRGVDKFLAFSISPPVHMTENGKAFSGRKRILNIAEGRLPDYAGFMVECIENLQKKEGIQFDYLSPINEPQWDWTAQANGMAGQEGTPATNKEIYDLTKLLSTKLKEKSLNTQVVVSEAGTISYLSGNVGNDDRDNQIYQFWDSQSSNKLTDLPNVFGGISGHSYFSVWPINKLVSDRQLLATKMRTVPNVKYWQSEYCILESPGSAEIPNGDGNKRDLGMQTALFVSRIIHNDIAIANASSWQWWTALSRADYKDGLIYLDEGGNLEPWNDPSYCKNDGSFRESKLLWALGNYSLFIRPHMVRINIVDEQSAVSAASNVMLTAYKETENRKIVIVAVNVSATTKSYNFDIAELKNNELTPYLTAEKENLQKMETVKANALEIPAKSVVTYVGTY